MKTGLAILRGLRSLLALYLVFLTVRAPENLVELGDQAASWHFGVLAYVLLAGGGLMLCAAYFRNDRTRPGWKEYLVPLALLILTLLRVFSPALFGCHCHPWFLKTAFQGYWRILLLTMAWIALLLFLQFLARHGHEDTPSEMPQ